MSKFLSVLGLAFSMAALQPLTAQTINEKAAGELVKRVVPVMFDQVKTISGVDVQAMLKGNNLYSVEQSEVLYAVQPDSAHVNLVNALKLNEDWASFGQYTQYLSALGVDATNIPLYFTDHKPMTIEALHLDVNFPAKVTTKTALGDIVLSFDWVMDPDFVINPFTTFSCDLQLTGSLNDLVQATAGSEMDLSWLHDGSVFSLTKVLEEDNVDVLIELGDAARGFSALTADPADVDNLPLENAQAIVTSWDLSELEEKNCATEQTYVLFNGAEEGSLVKEALHYNPSLFMQWADSVVTTTYNPETGDVVSMLKEASLKGAGSDEEGDFAFSIDSLFSKSDPDADWGEPVSLDSTRYQLGNETIDPENIMPGLIQSVYAALEAGEVAEPTIWAMGHHEFDKEVDAFLPTTSEALSMYRESPDSLTLVFSALKAVTEEDEEEPSFQTYLELTAGFSDTGLGTASLCLSDQEGEITEEGHVFTLFYTSDLMEHVDNEQVADAPELKIIAEGNRLRITGATNPVYQILNVLGQPLKVGVGHEVSIQDLPKGRIYVATVIDGDRQTTVKIML